MYSKEYIFILIEKSFSIQNSFLIKKKKQTNKTKQKKKDMFFHIDVASWILTLSLVLFSVHVLKFYRVLKIC